MDSEDTPYVPFVARQPSIGGTAFAEQMTTGLSSAENGEATDPSTMEVEDAAADVAELQPAPAESQEMDDDASGDDDRVLEIMKEKYPTLNAKTFHMKTLLAEKIKICDAQCDPYPLLRAMHQNCESMPEGDDKVHSIQMFNSVSAIFEVARSNHRLRGFLADVFTTQRNYHINKTKKREINTELRQQQQLYDEQVCSKSWSSP